MSKKIRVLYMEGVSPLRSQTVYHAVAYAMKEDSPNTIIMVSPDLDQNLQTALDAPLLGLGKAHCDVLTPDGQKRFVLYYATDLPQPCPTIPQTAVH